MAAFGAPSAFGAPAAFGAPQQVGAFGAVGQAASSVVASHVTDVLPDCVKPLLQENVATLPSSLLLLRATLPLEGAFGGDEHVWTALSSSLCVLGA